MPSAAATTAASLDEIDRSLQIARLALATAEASLAQLRRAADEQPRDDLGRYMRAAGVPDHRSGN